jgi:SulP family sulfate permease
VSGQDAEGATSSDDQATSDTSTAARAATLVRAKQAVVGWFRGIRPRREDLKADVLAGLPGAISSVPDGMATALLAGVNPAYGLYASFAGKIGGGLSTRTARSSR